MRSKTLHPWILGGVMAALLGSLFVAGCGTSSRTRRTERRPRTVQRDTVNPTSVLDDRIDEASLASADGEGDGVFLMAPAQADGQDGGGAAPAGNPRNAQQALEALKEDTKLRALEAEYQQRLGDDAFSHGDHAAAAKHYERALELSPGLARARERLHEVNLMLGRREGLVKSLNQDLQDYQEAETQMQLTDARRGLREVEKLLDEGDIDSINVAERNIGKIVDVLTLYEFPVDISAELAQAKALLSRVKEEKIRLQAEARRSQEELVEEEKDRLRRDEVRQRRARIRELTLKAADYMRFEDYEKAIQSCEQILEIDPNHRVARFWLSLARSERIDQLETRLISTDAELGEQNRSQLMESAIPWVNPFTFPEERIWSRIQKREQQLDVIQAEDPEAVREIKNLLETRTVSFSFEDKPLADVVAFLKQVTGINMEIDPEVTSEEDLTVNLSLQEIKARNALDLILQQTDLAHTFKYDVLYITRKEKARGNSRFEIFNVADILNKIRDFQGPKLELRAPGESDEAAGGIDISDDSADEETTISSDELVTLIKDSTGGEEVWGDDDLYSIEYHQGLLLVNAPVELHREVQKVLENLREDSDLFVMIEARFIDVTDDFLEDIGVDSRALGLVNNLGTPFGNIINDSRTGGNDIGFVKQGSPVRDVTLIMGQDRWAGRIQHIIDGFTGIVSGDRLRAGNGISGLSLQSTWLDPFQLNAILRAVQEKSDVRQLTAPTITAANGERVYVSVITQRAYIADYELVSGGTGFAIIEVADPIVATFQEGVILDVDPVISHDKKYITLDVRPTMATLIGGVISTILISLGSFTNVAFQVPIGIPEVSLQQTFTSVTVPNGGTVLLGGFKSLSEAKFESYLPILGRIPLLKNLFRRKANVSEKRSLVILLTARIINPRAEEQARFATN